jgi:hypothetical protein
MSSQAGATAAVCRNVSAASNVSSNCSPPARHFCREGYAAATMTEIAARAEAPISSLYQFFPPGSTRGHFGPKPCRVAHRNLEASRLRHGISPPRPSSRVSLECCRLTRGRAATLTDRSPNGRAYASGDISLSAAQAYRLDLRARSPTLSAGARGTVCCGS